MSNVSGIRHQDGRRAACRTLNTFRLVPHVLDVVHVMSIRKETALQMTAKHSQELNHEVGLSLSQHHGHRDASRAVIFGEDPGVSSATRRDPPTKYRQTDATRRVLSSKTHHLVMPANGNGDGHVNW